jgi:cytochrome c oxidase subunit II
MNFRLFPETASVWAENIEKLWWFEIAVAVIMTALIFVLVFLFAVKYRRRSENEKPLYIHGSVPLEIFWSVTPFLVMMVMFFWASALYYDYFTPPPDAMDVYITGKQWMWKVQYPEGQREINELHVPVGRAVKLTMASEDVIHSFFVPAFRLKRDVVPGRFNTTWFRATKPGRYHWFCAEYCGTQHSGMIGWVTVMEPAEYENWLSGGGVTGSMASQGEKLFQQLGCSTCHLLDEQGRCPILRNVYGNPVKLDDGRTVIADDGYIRESILNPNAKIVANFKRDIMPTFQGQVSEEGLMQLIAFIKGLSKNPQANQTIGARQTGQDSGASRLGGAVPRGAATAVQTGATPITERPQNPVQRKQ